MNQRSDSGDMLSRFLGRVEDALRDRPPTGGSIGIARAPAVVDVMGGIGEDTGSLVLTATAARSFCVAAWSVAGDGVTVTFAAYDTDVAPAEVTVPRSMLATSEDAVGKILDHCRSNGTPHLAPALLTLHRALISGVIPPLDSGLHLLVHTDFPEAADLGRHHVHAAAVIDAMCRLFGLEVDRIERSRVCAEALEPMGCLYQLRKVVTALCGPADGSLLQLRFQENLLCEMLEMPPGIVVKTMATRLERPTTLHRLIETRTCAEMGHCMIRALQQQDGAAPEAAASRLSAITPAEYVERYRDRMPSKITRKAFIERFGTLRGLDGDGAINPKGIYKIRSRAEHHIYENRRVHDFATNLVRARRNGTMKALVAAGELMYASHWSHSQRCGIGGVEPDRLVNFIRAHGPEAGLFGAKVTAGGEGGELVVLMRDDEQAEAALADAVAQAVAASQCEVHVFGGSLPGAESFEPPQLAGAV